MPTSHVLINCNALQRYNHPLFEQADVPSPQVTVEASSANQFWQFSLKGAPALKQLYLAGKDQTTDLDHDRQSIFQLNHSYWIDMFDHKMPTSYVP